MSEEDDETFFVSNDVSSSRVRHGLSDDQNSWLQTEENDALLSDTSGILNIQFG